MINSSRSSDRRDRAIRPRDDRGFKQALLKPSAKSKAVKQVTALVRGSRSLVKTQVADNLYDLPSCERAIAEGFQRVAWAIAMIRDKRLYEEAGHATFDDYCEDRLGWTRKRADQFAKAHFTVKSLPTICRKLIANEGQARALAKVPEESRVEVLERAASSGPVTAKSIRSSAEKKAPIVIDVEPEKPVAPGPRITLDISTCTICETETLCLLEGKARYCEPCIRAAFGARD